MMYGIPPADEPFPREPVVPAPAVPYPHHPPFWTPSGPSAGAVPLVPCARCRRHVRSGEECPFCYANAIEERMQEAIARELAKSSPLSTEETLGLRMMNKRLTEENELFAAQHKMLSKRLALLLDVFDAARALFVRTKAKDLKHRRATEIRSAGPSRGALKAECRSMTTTRHPTRTSSRKTT
jgi:hypothetical protein